MRRFLTITAGALAVLFLASCMISADSDDSDTGQYMRLAAANNMVDVMSVASTFTANANLNYCQLWGMTKEHWIRQAELEAFAEWGSGTAYDSDSVLIGSRLYENNAVMTANAVAQIDSFFDEISENVSAWKGTSAYDGWMDCHQILGKGY